MTLSKTLSKKVSKTVWVATLLLAVLLTLGCSSPKYELGFELELTDPDMGGWDSNCYGTGGYSDIEEGLSVTVRDGNGTILATERLGPGRKKFGKRCVFDTTIVNLPKTDFYSIEAGRRGELIYSFDELEANGWSITGTLG